MLKSIFSSFYLKVMIIVTILGLLFIVLINRSGSQKKVLNNNYSQSVQIKQNDKLQPVEIHLNSKVDLFDIGLAKINQDNTYDLYTVNHNFAESFYLFTDNQFKLNNELFEGLFSGGNQTIESTGETPNFNKPGFYMFSPLRKHIVLYCHECPKTVKGQLKVPVPNLEDKGVAVAYSQNAQYNFIESALTRYMLLNFELSPNSIIVLDAKYFSIVNQLSVDISANEIYLGPFKSNPSNNNFEFSHTDNHSFAFAQIDNTGDSSVFVSAGGLRSHLKYFSSDLVSQDQLLTYDKKHGHFDKKYHDPDFVKGDCRTYKAEWIDVNADGYLDLYVGCANSLNQLYMQDSSGSSGFTESAKAKEINVFHGDEFKWQDWNDDGYPDVFVIEKNQLRLYLNDKGQKFVLAHKSKNLGVKLSAVNSSIKIQDINNDGLLEILVSTSKEIFYFVQDGNDHFRMKRLRTLKLPENLKGHFNLVDVNLDGLVDIVFFDHGIYLQNKNNKFRKSNRYQSIFVNNKFNKFMSQIWFDSDINGRWDVLDASSIPKKALSHAKRAKHNLMGFEYKDIIKWDNLLYYKNLPKLNSNSWLQIDLIGDTFNRDAIGAKVIVNSNNQSQTRYNHGTQDSYHSQGHYRLYLGLGQSDSAQIEIIWPDKTISKYENVKANQLITISKL